MKTIEQLNRISIGPTTMIGPHYEFVGGKLLNVALNEYETEVHQIIRTIPAQAREEANSRFFAVSLIEQGGGFK